MFSSVSNTAVTTGTTVVSRGPVVGAYPCSRSAASTRSRVSGATSGRWLSTLEAVAVETPAVRATTFSVARFLARLGGALMKRRYQVPKSSTQVSHTLTAGGRLLYG